MRQTLLQRKIHLQPDEELIIVVRKHWFILLRDSIGVVIVGVLPFLFVGTFAPIIPATPALASFFTSLWLLVVWLMLFTIWTNYYLDMWVVTDKRIINIDQIHLFKRDISILRVERVQDVKVEVHGFFATMLKFGNLQVQTASPEESYTVIKGIPTPQLIRNMILEHVDMTTEHKNRYEYNVEQRPSQAE